MFLYLSVFLLVILGWLYKLKRENENVSYKARFYHKNCRLSQFLLHKWTALEEGYRPTFWAVNAHLQSLLYLIWPRQSVRYRREYLQSEDRGVVALDWVITNEKSLNPASPVLIVIPELTCSIYEVSTLFYRAADYNFRYVVFNHRGHGGSVLTTALLQSATESKDLEEAICYVHTIYPCAKILALAYSSGSALLLSYLEDTKKHYVSGAVCISPCYEMDKGWDNVLPAFYEYFLTKRLVYLLRQHPGLSSVIDYDLAIKSNTVKEFKQRVFDPLLDVPETQSTFRNFTSQNVLNNNFSNIARIRVPTLCISALDDPICSKNTIPFSLFKNSSNFYLITCEKGGHRGFFQNDIFLSSWADHIACTFLEAMNNFNFRKPMENSSPFLLPHLTRDRSYTQ